MPLFHGSESRHYGLGSPRPLVRAPKRLFVSITSSRYCGCETRIGQLAIRGLFETAIRDGGSDVERLDLALDCKRLCRQRQPYRSGGFSKSAGAQVIPSKYTRLFVVAVIDATIGTVAPSFRSLTIFVPHNFRGSLLKDFASAHLKPAAVHEGKPKFPCRSFAALSERALRVVASMATDGCCRSTSRDRSTTTAMPRPHRDSDTVNATPNRPLWEICLISHRRLPALPSRSDHVFLSLMRYHPVHAAETLTTI